MFNPSKPLSAVLPNIIGANLPPLDLGIASQFQFCVDAGAVAAVGFFSGLSDFTLHNHIAYALQSFATSVGVGMAASGNCDAAKMQSCIDAFAAGYLGRVQQELRLFHGDACGHAMGRATDAHRMN
jgi:hypothetical protein